jgi:outer membrane protein assembly factor BamD (BamD/ComL family)
MAISGVSNNNTMQQAWQTNMQQRKQDFSQLGSALQSGDLASAQKAFTDLQSLQPGGTAQGSGGAATNSTNNSSGNTSSNDFAALGQALQSGNLTDAQNAFAKIQSDMQAHKGGHHHHHHGGGAVSSANVSTPTPTPTQSTASPGSTINITA